MNVHCDLYLPSAHATAGDFQVTGALKFQLRQDSVAPGCRESQIAKGSALMRHLAKVARPNPHSGVNCGAEGRTGRYSL